MLIGIVAIILGLFSFIFPNQLHSFVIKLSHLPILPIFGGRGSFGRGEKREIGISARASYSSEDGWVPGNRIIPLLRFYRPAGALLILAGLLNVLGIIGS